MFHIVSCDEKTGIQAIEREEPNKPARPGLVEKIEYNYIRHGTQTLIATMDVRTGKIIQADVGDTRTEADFLQHITATIEQDSGGRWVFVLDQLNTHKSESLVMLVAKLEGDFQDLGKKGRFGILKNMASRKEYLEDQNHRISFLFTPKHTSWMNQIEIWFSILVRRFLKRAQFKSKKELRRRLLDFIEYFNRTLAKPFKWTYQGKPLQA